MLWCFYQTLILTAPIHWCRDTFIQTWWRNKLSDGLRVRLFSSNVHFWMPFGNHASLEFNAQPSNRQLSLRMNDFQMLWWRNSNSPLDLLGKLVIYRTNTCAFAKLFCNSPETLPPSRCLFLFTLIWVPTVGGDIMKPLKRRSPPGLQERRDAFLGICHRWALASISAAPQRTTTTGAEIIDSFQNQSRHILLIFTPAHSHDTFSNTTESCAHS